ncbi:MAG: D-aminoacyl-tRNA deacylase [Candidatus Micrarchaeota archaeon]
MPAIVFSEADSAGVNIARALISKYKFEKTIEKKWEREGVELIGVPELLVETKIDLEVDYAIFASRHRSEKKLPALTTHVCGNWGAKAEVGGNPRELAIAPALAMKSAFSYLAKNPLAGFDSTMECTHHGPTSLKMPFFFIEIGSSEIEWKNEEAVERIADAIMHTIEEGKRGFARAKVALGIGTPHYCPSFSVIEALPEIAFAHMLPNYAIDGADEETMFQALEKSVEKVELVVLDWKGLKAEQRTRAMEFAKNAGLECVKDKELRRGGNSKV